MGLSRFGSLTRGRMRATRNNSSAYNQLTRPKTCPRHGGENESADPNPATATHFRTWSTTVCNGLGSHLLSDWPKHGSSPIFSRWTGTPERLGGAIAAPKKTLTIDRMKCGRVARVAQALDLAGTANTVGAPSFAKGGQHEHYRHPLRIEKQFRREQHRGPPLRLRLGQALAKYARMGHPQFGWPKQNQNRRVGHRPTRPGPPVPPVGHCLGPEPARSARSAIVGVECGSGCARPGRF